MHTLLTNNPMKVSNVKCKLKHYISFWVHCCCRCHQHIHLDEIFFHHISMNTTCWQIVDENTKHVNWNASKVHAFISREKRGVRSPSLMFLYTCVPTRSFYDILLRYLFFLIPITLPEVRDVECHRKPPWKPLECIRWMNVSPTTPHHIQMSFIHDPPLFALKITRNLHHPS